MRQLLEGSRTCWVLWVGVMFHVCGDLFWGTLTVKVHVCILAYLGFLGGQMLSIWANAHSDKEKSEVQNPPPENELMKMLARILAVAFLAIFGDFGDFGDFGAARPKHPSPRKTIPQPLKDSTSTINPIHPENLI